jgi:hypothetical protein
MRVLIISYLFPPAESPRAYRWAALSNYFAEQGIGVDVVCAGPSVAEFAPSPGVVVAAVPPSAIQVARERAIRAAPQGRKRHEGWLRRRLRRVIGSFRWPDYSLSWTEPAYRKARQLIETHRHDAVISVSLPYSAHLVAQRLKQEGRLRGVWLVDVGDPYSLPGNSTQVYGQRFLARSQRSERGILRDCDRWFVTDPGARDALTRVLEIDARKSLVAPPILTIPVTAPQSIGGPLAAIRERRPMRFAYAGIFYEHVRPIERLGTLVEFLAAELGAKGFEIDLFGDNERWRARLAAYSAASTKHVRFHGALPRAALLPRLAEYDALLNFGNSTPFQVPSKVIEYAALGLPIINVKGRSDDTSEHLLEGYPFATSLLIPDDGRREWEAETKQRLHGFLSKPERSASDDDQRATWLARFSTSRVGDVYLGAIPPL